MILFSPSFLSSQRQVTSGTSLQLWVCSFLEMAASQWNPMHRQGVYSFWLRAYNSKPSVSITLPCSRTRARVRAPVSQNSGSVCIILLSSMGPLCTSQTPYAMSNANQNISTFPRLRHSQDSCCQDFRSFEEFLNLFNSKP